MVRTRTGTILVVGILLLVPLASCSTSQNPQPSGSSSTSGALQLIKPGTLTIGADLATPPFDYTENGVLKGFDVELVNAIAGRLNLKPEWIKSAWSTIFTALAAGKFDVVASGPTVTKDRLQIVDFTRPYFSTALALITNPAKNPGVVKFGDLSSGDVVGVQKGGPELSWSQANLAPRGVDIKTYEDFGAAVLDLQAGRLTAVVGDSSISDPQIVTHPGLVISDLIPTNNSYAYAVRKGNEGLTAAMNDAMGALFADGTFGQIWKKYFTIPVPSELPTLTNIPKS